MANIIWSGDFYKRKKSGTYRSRSTGEIIAQKPRVIKRRGRDVIIIPRGTRVLGVEETKHHFSGMDKKPILKTSPRIINATRTRSRAEQKALFAKLKGRR